MEPLGAVLSISELTYWFGGILENRIFRSKGQMKARPIDWKPVALFDELGKTYILRRGLLEENAHNTRDKSVVFSLPDYAENYCYK